MIPYTLRFLPAGLLAAVLLATACAPVGETTEEPERAAAAEEAPAEQLHPEWYETALQGDVAGGKLVSYASSPGSDAAWARNNAEAQAMANLKAWIDLQLENARREVSRTDESASERELILQLRNAVNRLDLSRAEITSESRERSNGAVQVYVKAEIPSTELLEEMGSNLGGHETVWSRILDSEALQGWREN